jgi:hypothetical protein
VTAKTQLFLLLGALCLPLAVACEKGHGAAQPPVSALREAGASSKDPEEVGRWLLGELVSSGGSTKQAANARRRLDSLGGRGLYASMARGLDSASHGELGKVSAAYLDALLAARDSRDARTPLFAWLAAHDAAGFQHASPDFWQRHHDKVEGLLRNPGRIGWRARLELAEWWARRTASRRSATG